MTGFKVADPIDDIARQARQGSVAAIIQLLNDKLVDAGIRTRAILADGILQILCEAAQPEQLEQAPLVQRIQQILEAIAPRNIRRVNINSRIVREQQLLWLEEISRDPQGQLLWSEEIVLAQPNFLKRLMQDSKDRRSVHLQSNFAPPPSSHQVREQRQFWRGIVGGASLSLFVLLVGGVSWTWLSSRFTEQVQSATVSPTAPQTPSSAATPVSAPSQAPTPGDPFVKAVRLAEQAAALGKAAQTPAEWLDIAAKWQQASDLMAEVSPQETRYATAQNRTTVYRKNSEAALKEAEKRRTQAPAAAPPQPATP